MLGPFQVSIIFAILVLIYGQQNLLLKVPVAVSEYPEYAKYLNDNDTVSRLMYFESSEVKWAVFDMGDTYQLTNITMYNYGTRSLPISFYIGNEFMPCKFHRQITKYNLCASNVIQNTKINKIVCQNSKDTGRYLALVKGDFGSQTNFEYMYIIEVQAFGNKVLGPAIPTRPIIQNTTIDPIPVDAFAIAKAIHAGVSTVSVPWYSTGLTYLNKRCQPIIWDPSTMKYFAIACKTKNDMGRFVAFGKEAYFSDLVSLQPSSQLTINLKTWLSPTTTNPALISTRYITTLSALRTKVKAGDILDFYTWIAYPKEVLDAMIDLCNNGTNAIVLDHTFWVATDASVMDSFTRILREFNVDYNINSYVTWSSAQNFAITSDIYVEKLLGSEFILRCMAQNFDYFMKQGDAIATDLASMAPYLIVNSEVGSLLKDLINKYDPLINWICPCQVGPASDLNDRKIIAIYTKLINSQTLVNSNYKLPCLDLFPGDFEQPPPTTSVTVTIQSQSNSTDYPIGFYLAAGATLKYKVVNSQGNWAMSVGCHTDTLDDRRSQWYRYPSVFVDRVGLASSGEIYSPYGGTIWLYNSVAQQTITVQLSNVVATPFFNNRDASSAANWATQRNNPGLWAQIAGQNIIVCEKSKRVKDYDGNYMSNLMTNTWDKLVRMDYALSGLDWRTARPQKVAIDVMITIGYGHSGYPIEVYDDWYPNVFNQTMINAQGSWGMCHEIGHNIQDQRWTYKGLTEVTNNVLCLFNYDKLWKLPRFGSNVTVLNNYQDTIKAYLNNGASYSEYQNNPWIALSIYSQMAAFMGWGFFKQVFGYYQSNNLNPIDDASKISTWIVVTSQISKQNLIPLFTFWGIPVSADVVSQVGSLPCFFPDDFFTQFSPTRVTTVLSQFPNCNKKSTFFVDFDPSSAIVGTLPNFITTT